RIRGEQACGRRTHQIGGTRSRLFRGTRQLGGPRSNRDWHAKPLHRHCGEKGGSGGDRPAQTSRETRRDRPDHHVSRIRQGVVHHRCLVPRGRRQDSPVISSAVAFLGSDTRLSSEGVTPYRDIRRGTMNQTIESKNKALVLEAFDTLFNKRDYAAAERYWSPNYIQHSAHIEPGRDGLFKLIKSIPPTLKYEPGTIVAEKEFVIVHGRFSGFGQPVNWIAADIVRVKDGILVEHWDVIEDEATQEQSKSGQPMFGDKFPT